MQRGASIKKYSSIQGGAGLFVSVGALVASAFLAFGLVAKLSNNLFPWLEGKTLRVVGCPNLPFLQLVSHLQLVAARLVAVIPAAGPGTI